LVPFGHLRRWPRYLPGGPSPPEPPQLVVAVSWSASVWRSAEARGLPVAVSGSASVLRSAEARGLPVAVSGSASVMRSAEGRGLVVLVSWSASVWACLCLSAAAIWSMSMKPPARP
jgi:hypothetical protein